SDSNTPPHLTDWGGKHYPPAEAFRREPGADLWHVKNDAPSANESHAATLQQTLEHINAVPQGKELLTRLKAQMGQGKPLLFIARADWTPQREGVDIPKTVRPVNVVDQPGSIAIEVNADYLQKNVLGQGGNVHTTPAKAIRYVYADLLRTEHLIDRVQQGRPTDFHSYRQDKGIEANVSKADRLSALHGYFTDELKVSLAGDQFYGQLTASNNDGSTFRYGLNYTLTKGGMPLAMSVPGSIIFNNRVLHQMEIIPEANWASTYADAIKKSNLSGGTKLAFEPIKTGIQGTEWKTPLRVVLNTLDTRIDTLSFCK
ncbi:MAG: hypothetical protein KGN35_05295, partial [Betaproteobacteria bacterium]|nr:hypothetical protein [Betaproteobacteria bacterium]